MHVIFNETSESIVSYNGPLHFVQLRKSMYTFSFKPWNQEYYSCVSKMWNVTGLTHFSQKWIGNNRIHAYDYYTVLRLKSYVFVKYALILISSVKIIRIWDLQIVTSFVKKKKVHVIRNLTDSIVSNLGLLRFFQLR